jgi:AhpC/TSA family
MHSSYSSYTARKCLPHIGKLRGENVSLRINDIAPDFTAETTQGTISFHEWIGDGWAGLFSHPKDFTPVCTTELGSVAGLYPEFQKRNTKVVGLSVDPVSSHGKWACCCISLCTRRLPTRTPRALNSRQMRGQP